MWNDGHYILWQHFIQLFHQDLDNGLKLLPRLTYDHIKLSAYSTMRVNLAVQILSASVANVLKSFGPPDTIATSKLCEMMDNFFDCLNVRNQHEHVRKRKPFLKPYSSLNDQRFAWLTNYFLGYSRNWRPRGSLVGEVITQVCVNLVTTITSLECNALSPVSLVIPMAGKTKTRHGLMSQMTLSQKGRKLNNADIADYYNLCISK